MKTTTVLRKAAAIVLTPGRWTQGNYAKDRDGFTVDVDSQEAQSFCAIGAMLRVDLLTNAPTYSSRESLYAWTANGVTELNDLPTTTAEDMGTFLLLVAEAEETGSRP